MTLQEAIAYARESASSPGDWDDIAYFVDAVRSGDIGESEAIAELIAYAERGDEE